MLWESYLLKEKFKSTKRDNIQKVKGGEKGNLIL